MAFSNEDRQKIIEALGAKRKNNVCPVCSANSWILAENFIPLSLQDVSSGLVIGGPSIPAIALVCKNCGYIAMHASKVLANLPVEGTQRD